MSYRLEKESGDVVISGFENGIQPSPHKGVANIQNANISTETGEVMNSYVRVQDSMTETATTGSLSYLSTDHVNLSITGSNNLFKGNWITVTNSSNTGQLPNGTYYVPPSSGAGFELSNYYNTANYIPQISATVFAQGGGGGGGGMSSVHGGAGGGGGGEYVPGTQTIRNGEVYTINIGSGGGGVNAGAGIPGAPTMMSGLPVTAKTLTATPSMGDTSATLTSSWTGTGGNYTGVFSSGDARIISLTNGSASFSWLTPLSAGASTAFTINALLVGAGGGGGGGQVNAAGLSGGSGGGAGGPNANIGGLAIHGMGGSAGGATTGGSSIGGGGGGGASATGGSSGAGSPGVGGAGMANSISGSSVTYGGGGGGGIYNSGGSTPGGAGGAGGGGNGENITGGNGTANTGGGGGGGGSIGSGNTAGGSGGSGIFIISIPTSMGVTAVGGTHTISGGNDIWTFTSGGTWVPTVPSTVVAPILTGLTAGLTATIQLAAVMGKPLAQAIETYFRNGIVYYRYYILDNQNLVWVYDDYNETLYSITDGVSWFLPDTSTAWCTTASGIAVISGFLIGATNTGLFSKPTTMLGNTNVTTTTWVQVSDITGWKGAERSTSIIHFCYVGHQGALYITDGAYIVSVFPDSALADPGNSTSQNIQSFCSWTASDTNTGLYTVISGTTPVPDDDKRVPIVFFTPNDGTLPYSITAGVVYYAEMFINPYEFNVFTDSTGGSPIDIETGANGTQYFNTFYPYGSSTTSSEGTTPTYTYTNPQVALPVFEVAQCMAEIGTIIIIGCQSSTVYPWNQQSTQASSIISLPEANVVNIVTVHQMAYIFAGNKGNIYITDGSVASLVSSIPDYCAGIPGNPASYIEPVFSWGGAGYVRGRVYFSVLDQTTIKAGNCGGIWSFVPTQNFYIGQDVGIALRQENQSSYGTYNGVSPVIIPKVKQNVASPQYFSAWYSDVSTPTYGIDATGTGTSTTSQAVAETDIVPTGTMLNKKSFSQVEYKLTTPLLAGDIVTMNYRKDMTSAWKSCGTSKLQNDKLSGYFSATFEKTQWLQLQAILTPGSSSSFVRLVEIRLRD